uniref:Uncharacterized protein n=1 Tax=Medicago truncatula TaxID=3880 RepID=I3SM69_MEDTR|nr:unknown [Medicago truncatula]
MTRSIISIPFKPSPSITSSTSTTTTSISSATSIHISSSSSSSSSSTSITIISHKSVHRLPPRNIIRFSISRSLPNADMPIHYRSLRSFLSCFFQRLPPPPPTSRQHLWHSHYKSIITLTITR